MARNAGEVANDFGGLVRRHLHGFTADEDVEFFGVQDDAAVLGINGLPELADFVGADPTQVALCYGSADGVAVLDPVLNAFGEYLHAKAGHKPGRQHQLDADYFARIAAMDYAMTHDDGQSLSDLEHADVILVGVSRSGKTPTSLYLAMQFGVKAANYPLIPEDFERNKLPGELHKYRTKLFGLTIAPERLSQIRQERRPNSRYASLENCRYEIDAAQKLMRRENIRWLESTTKSIEEISATILQTVRVERPGF